MWDGIRLPWQELYDAKSWLKGINEDVTIEKNNLNLSVDEVKDFLMNKCTFVKKKKFINCTNDKKLSLVFLIALIVVSVIGTVVGLVLKINSIF